MRLAEYLKERDISPTAFARDIGTYPQTIHKYIHRQRTPCAEMMGKIVVATKGAVQPNDFFDLNPEAIIGNHTTITQQNHVEPGGKHAGK